MLVRDVILYFINNRPTFRKQMDQYNVNNGTTLEVHRNRADFNRKEQILARSGVNRII